MNVTTRLLSSFAAITLAAVAGCAASAAPDDAVGRTSSAMTKLDPDPVNCHFTTRGCGDEWPGGGGSSGGGSSSGGSSSGGSSSGGSSSGGGGGSAPLTPPEPPSGPDDGDPDPISGNPQIPVAPGDYDLPISSHGPTGPGCIFRCSRLSGTAKDECLGACD